MRIPTAAGLVTAGLAFLVQAAWACDPELRFRDKATCAANRQAIIDIVNDPKFQAGFLTQNVANRYNDPHVSQCTTSTFCLKYCAYITMDLFDGGPGYKVGRACEELKKRVSERKLLDQPVEPTKDAANRPPQGLPENIRPWNNDGATDGRPGDEKAL